MSQEFKVASYWKRGKICKKIHLIGQKTCNLLSQLRKHAHKENKVVDGNCKKAAVTL